MDELIQTFHIDWHLMLAQLINFAIVAFVLWRFALKPLMKVLQERSDTVEKSLQDARAIEKRVRETDSDIAQKLSEARAQSHAIINDAKKQAEVKRQELLTHAKKEVEKVVQNAKDQIQQEKVMMLQDARKELGDLVVAGISKVLGKTISEKVDKEIVKEQVHRLK